MRTVTYRLDDLKKVVIPIGKVAENEYTRVQVDAGVIYAAYPHASVALTVQPPEGEPYPAVVTRDGDMVIWDVKDSDLVAEGDGEIQYTFSAGSMVKKSDAARTIVCRSIIGEGEASDPLADFIAEAGIALTAIPETIDAALEAAKESGDFDGPAGPAGSDGADGADGFSPVVAVSSISGGHSVSVTDASSTQTFNVMDGVDGQNGQPGTDGFSPSASVTKSGSVATIVITDKDGTTTAQISDGEGADVIDDTSTASDKAWSASKVSGELSNLNSALTQKYEKPQTGIPASDLASGVIPVVTGFASKVSSATSGHFAGLDGNGDLTDSGKSASDFGTYSKPSGGIPETDLSSSLTGFIGDTSTNLGSTTETTITDLTNMTIASATEGNVQLTITKTHITAYGVCNATRIRTLQDNIVCSAGNYEFSVGTIIPTAGYQIQVFNVTDNEVLVSAAASATSPVITFTLATQKTLRLRALVTSGKSIDSSNEVYLHKVVSASTPNTLASVAKGIVDGHLHGKNILAFGDSLWGDDRTNGISDFLAEYSGATIYNAGIGGTRITGDRTTSEGEKFIPFDGVTLINALISNTWTDQDAQINNIWTYVKNDTLPMLKALDLQTIDIVILAYGTNDFTANKSISDVSTAFLSAVSALLTANPKLRIICILPPWRMFTSGTVDGDSYENSNNDTLQEFNEGIISAIKPKHTETMNMFEQLPWRAETKGHYMDSDAVHPNRNGNMVYAHVVNGKLKTMY